MKRPPPSQAPGPETPDDPQDGDNRRLPVPAMSGGVIGLFARHPNAANLVMVLMIIFGIFSMGRINTQFFPTLEIDTVTISVVWSGASAEDVEANILEIIEPEVRFIDGVDTMTSYAREGAGTISLEFQAGTDMQQATADVDTAVKAIATLPDDAEAAKVSRVAFFDQVANVSVSGKVPEATLRIYAKTIRDELIARGIDKIEFKGLRDRELQVQIPERELRRLDLSIADIARMVEGNSRDMPSGQTRGQVEQQIRAIAEFETPGSISNIEIRSFSSGEKVLLGDVADIRFGFDDDQVRGVSGELKAIELSVRRAPSADTLATAKILDDYLAEIAATVPPGIDIRKYNVASDALVKRLMLLVRNGLGGLVLVVLVLFIFLNARVAFWVAVGIPVALLATIGFMNLFGESINMISLFGLIMMLGIIVDDAIVVGEHTATRFDEGDSPIIAAETGAGRMATPVIAAMITTATAFAPILLIRDTIGQIMGVLPIVVIAVLIASLIECFLVLPGHLAHALKPRRRRPWSYLRHLFFSFLIGGALLALSLRAANNDTGTSLALLNQLASARADYPAPIFLLLLASGAFLVGAAIEGLLALLRRRTAGAANDGELEFEQEGWFRRSFDRQFERFRAGPFSWLVERAFHWRYVTAAIAVSMLMVVAVGLISGGRVPFVFFQPPEAETINARIEFNAGVPEEQVDAAIIRVQHALGHAVDALAGDGPSPVSATFTTIGEAGRNVGDNLALMRVQLTASEVRDIRTPDIISQWRKIVPKMAGVKRVAIFQSRGGPPGRDIDLKLTGGDVAALKQAASEIIGLVAALPGSTGVSDDLPFGKPERIMRLTPKGSALGFTIGDVGRQVRDAFEGSIPRRFADGDDEVTIRLTRLSRDAGAAALRNFELHTSQGEFVPLTEIVSLEEKQGFSAIRRENGETIVSITADLDTDILTTEAAIGLLTGGGMPEIAARYGLEWEFGGRDEERRKAFEDLGLGVTIAMSVIYIILAWVFSSYWRPFAIMAIIPFGIVGAVFGHWLLGFNLTIMSMISLLGLTGILVNDSLVLVRRLDERLAEGETVALAAIGASRDRLRAVLLTSLTTIGGLVPLMFEQSVQAKFIVPMAVTIIFGLGIATLLVLFLVPAFIGIGDDIGRTVRSIFAQRQIVPGSARP